MTRRVAAPAETARLGPNDRRLLRSFGCLAGCSATDATVGRPSRGSPVPLGGQFRRQGPHAANSAWRQLAGLADNLLTSFQIETGAICRSWSRKRTVRPVLHTVQTLRFVRFHRAALLVGLQGSAVLRLTDNAETKPTLGRNTPADVTLLRPRCQSRGTSRGTAAKCR